MLLHTEGTCSTKNNTPLFLPEKCLQVICLDTDQCTTTNVLRDSFRYGPKSGMSVRVLTCPHRLLHVYVVVQICFLVEKIKTSFSLFSFVSDDSNGAETKETKYKTGLKIFKPKKKLSYNIHFICCKFIS